MVNHTISRIHFIYINLGAEILVLRNHKICRKLKEFVGKPLWFFGISENRKYGQTVWFCHCQRRVWHPKSDPKHGHLHTFPNCSYHWGLRHYLKRLKIASKSLNRSISEQSKFKKLDFSNIVHKFAMVNHTIFQIHFIHTN